MEFPSQPEPVTGDMQKGLSSTLKDNAVANVSHVLSQTPNNNIVSIYSVQENESDTITHPFVHSVELKGEKGIPVKITGLFNDGTLVNTICKMKFLLLKPTLGELTPSLKTL